MSDLLIERKRLIAGHFPAAPVLSDFQIFLAIRFHAAATGC